MRLLAADFYWILVPGLSFLRISPPDAILGRLVL